MKRSGIHARVQRLVSCTLSRAPRSLRKYPILAIGCRIRTEARHSNPRARDSFDYAKRQACQLPMLREHLKLSRRRRQRAPPSAQLSQYLFRFRPRFNLVPTLYEFLCPFTRYPDISCGIFDNSLVVSVWTRLIGQSQIPSSPTKTGLIRPSYQIPKRPGIQKGCQQVKHYSPVFALRHVHSPQFSAWCTQLTSLRSSVLRTCFSSGGSPTSHRSPPCRFRRCHPPKGPSASSNSWLPEKTALRRESPVTTVLSKSVRFPMGRRS